MVSTKGCFLTEEGSFFSNRYRQTQNALSTAAAGSKSPLLPNMTKGSLHTCFLCMLKRKMAVRILPKAEQFLIVGYKFTPLCDCVLRKLLCPVGKKKTKKNPHTLSRESVTKTATLNWLKTKGKNEEKKKRKKPCTKCTINQVWGGKPKSIWTHTYKTEKKMMKQQKKACPSAFATLR